MGLTTRQAVELKQIIEAAVRINGYTFLSDVLRNSGLPLSLTALGKDDGEVSLKAVLGNLHIPQIPNSLPYTKSPIRYTLTGPVYCPSEYLIGDGFIGFNKKDFGAPGWMQNMCTAGSPIAHSFRFNPECFDRYGLLYSIRRVMIQSLLLDFNACQARIFSDKELHLHEFIEAVNSLLSVLNPVARRTYFPGAFQADFSRRFDLGKEELSEEDIDVFAHYWCNKIMPAVEDLQQWINQCIDAYHCI